MPPGTKVKRRDGGQLGVVQAYRADAVSAKIGLFPVAWVLHGVIGAWWYTWETCGTDDVLLVVEPVSGSGAA